MIAILFVWYLGVGIIGAISNAYITWYQGDQYTRKQRLTQTLSIIFGWPFVSWVMLRG